MYSSVHRSPSPRSNLVPPIVVGLLFGLATVVALLATNARADVSPAPGSVSVSPSSVRAGSIHDYFIRYTAPAGGANLSVEIRIPPDWTRPQSADATAAGFVAVGARSCNASRDAVIGNVDGSSTIFVGARCHSGAFFVVKYLAATAPTRAVPSEFTARAEIGDFSHGHPFAPQPSVDVVAGASAGLAFATQPQRLVAAGDHLVPAPRVQVVDAYGNPTASTARVTVGVGTNPVGGTLSGRTTVDASAGLATFGDLSIDRAGRVYTLSANAVGMTGTTSTGFSVVPAPLDHLVLSSESNTIVAGGSETFRARGVDAFGNPMGKVTGATFTITPDGSCDGATCTATQAGDHLVTATSATKTGSARLRVKPAAPAALNFDSEPVTSTAVDHIRHDPSVQVVDVYGNLVHAETPVTMKLATNPAGGALTGITIVQAINGVAAFRELFIAKAGTGYALSASSPGLADAVSSTFNVVPGPLDHLALSPKSATTNTVTPQSYRAVGVDASGNLLRDFTDATRFTIAPTGSCHVDVCQATTPGDRTVTGTFFGRTGTAVLHVTVGPPAALTFAVQPSKTRAGAPIGPSPAVRIVDAHGNPTRSTADITLSIGTNPRSATLSGTTTVAASAGLATFPGLSVDKTANGYTLVATAATIGSDTSTAFDVTWAPTGDLPIPRNGGPAVLLHNGKVLVLGGLDVHGRPLASADLYDPTTGTWSSTGSIDAARTAGPAIVLADGRVLVIGGYVSSGPPFSSAEIYDPSTETWSSTSPPSLDRGGFSATLLSSGKVLVAGGRDRLGDLMASAELYDPGTGTWSVTGTMTTTRSLHSATLLHNGQVLVFGGNLSTDNPTAELYDPATGRWTATGTLVYENPREAASVTLLTDGRVLVAGGAFPDTSIGPEAGAEVYDPGTGTWSATGAMTSPRAYQAASLLPDGRVLVAGGWDGRAFLSSAEVYDPTSGTWSATGGMTTIRVDAHAILLNNGKVLVVLGDGSTSAELYF